jgi:signal transduction histidine kinase
MQPHASDRRSLKRQVTLARPLLLVLSLVSVLELPAPPPSVLIFQGVYLAASLLFAAAQATAWGADWKFPLAADVAALGAFLVFAPSVAPMWFLLLFVAFAAAVEWGIRPAYWIVVASSAAVLVWTLLQHHAAWEDGVRAVAVASGTLAAGFGMAYLGDRNRRSAMEYHFLAGLNEVLRVDAGVADSLRGLFEKLMEAFACDAGVLAYRDADVERIFVWKLARGDGGRIAPENWPLSAGEGLLLDAPEATIGVNNFDGKGDGFGWNRETGNRLAELPRFSASTREALGMRSALATTIDVQGDPAARLILANGQRRFTPRDLLWLERIARHLGTPLENLFLLRHLRARAIDAERSRISRDLHDGILQTLLSVQIQLDVLRKKLPEEGDTVAAALGSLEQTVRNESAELRRMVTDLRPLRVQSADLLDLMRGFAERFRNDSQLKLDLLVDAADLQAPDRVCRELFQIYREALNNIKKHARATHVVVKLSQSDSRIALVVDDNGEGFSFAGRFSGDELDRLRLGPISIKERTRTVGGVLTVESSPGHGAKLTVEVPLS